MASEHTSADDIVFDLISIQYHALRSAEACDRYLEDVHDHEDVAEFIRNNRDEDNARAQRAHELLGKLTARSGIG